MTILTKPSNEKKAEKIPLPLALGGVGHDEVSMMPGGVAHGTLLTQHPIYNHDIDSESMVFNNSVQFSCIKTTLLFLISVILLMMGLLGGYTLYRMYSPSHSSMHYRALCDIPYNTISNMSLPRLYTPTDEYELNWRSFFPRFGDEEPYNDLVDDNFFREEIELDRSDDKNYAKVNVPDFKGGRHGRFMHDFKMNQSAIIDTKANRCFIMPLDHDTTLPPKSLMDLMQKIRNGYYNIDTDRVRRTMRVVTPPIKDLNEISERIANECFDMKIYMLENYVSGVFKREVKMITDSGKFAEFAGHGIIEYDLINIADIEELELKEKK